MTHIFHQHYTALLQVQFCRYYNFFLVWKPVTIHNDYKINDFIKLHFTFIGKLCFCSSAFIG